MRAIALLSALVMATAARATAMNSEHEQHSPAQAHVTEASPSVAALQCLRHVDRFGNIRVICPNRNEARRAWTSRRPFYPRNFTVFYHDGRRFRTFNRWGGPVRR